MNSVLTHFFWLGALLSSFFPPPSCYSWTHTNSYNIFPMPPTRRPSRLFQCLRYFVCINAINNTCILFRDTQRALFIASPRHMHTHTHTQTRTIHLAKEKRKKNEEKEEEEEGNIKNSRSEFITPRRVGNFLNQKPSASISLLLFFVFYYTSV